MSSSRLPLVTCLVTAYDVEGAGCPYVLWRPTSIAAIRGCSRASRAGRPVSALPWCATLSTSTGPSRSGPVTSVSASAVRSALTPPASSRQFLARASSVLMSSLSAASSVLPVALVWGNTSQRMRIAASGLAIAKIVPFA